LRVNNNSNLCTSTRNSDKKWQASTGNKGKTFYACGQPRESQCGFFLWTDDSKSSVLKTISSGESVELPGPAFHSLSVAELKSMASKLGARKTGSKSLLAESLSKLWKAKEKDADELVNLDAETVLQTVFGHDEFLYVKETNLQTSNPIIVHFLGTE